MEGILNTTTSDLTMANLSNLTIDNLTMDNLTMGNLSNLIMIMPKEPPVVEVGILFAFIIFIGVVGNGLLIVTVLANKAMHSVPNIFLVSLAIGDLAVLILSVPFRMLLYLHAEWVYGGTMCHIFEFIIHLSQGISIFTLTALAGDRFVAIVLPMQTFLWVTRKRAVLISLSIWLLAFLLALPDIITSDIVVSDAGIKMCFTYALIAQTSRQDIDMHPYVLSRRISTFTAYFVIPFCIISTFYVAIAVSLHRSQVMPANFKLAQGKTWEKQVRARKKIAMIILVITACFLVCWFPRYVFIFLSGYHTPRLSFAKVQHYKTATYVLSFLNSCINPPFLYLMSADFKRYFNHYLFGACCHSMRLKRYARNSLSMTTYPSRATTARVSFEDLALKQIPVHA